MGKRLLQLLSFGLVFGLDLLALATINVGGFFSTNYWGEAFAFHAASMATMVGYLCLWFPIGYRRKPIILLALVIGFGTALPLFAPIFLALIGLLLERYQQTGQVDAVDFVSIKPNLSLGMPAPTDSPQRSILEDFNSKHRERRRRGVLTLRSVDIKQSIPLLQRAARDSDEQVRLLAQAQFSRIHERIEARIKSLDRHQRQFPKDVYSGRILADLHHEIVNLGLSGDAAESIHMNRSIDLIDEAITNSAPRPSDWLLQLKCHLRLRQISQAKHCLSQLKKSKYPQTLLHIWEAEIAFLSRDWRGVEKAVSAMASGHSAAPRITNIIQSWLPKPAPHSQ